MADGGGLVGAGSRSRGKADDGELREHEGRDRGHAHDALRVREGAGGRPSTGSSRRCPAARPGSPASSESIAGNATAGWSAPPSSSTSTPGRAWRKHVASHASEEPRLQFVLDVASGRERRAPAGPPPTEVFSQQPRPRYRTQCSSSLAIARSSTSRSRIRLRDSPAGRLNDRRVHQRVAKIRKKGDGKVTLAAQKPEIYRHFVLATPALSRRTSRVRVPSLPLRRAPQYTAVARMGRAYGTR